MFALDQVGGVVNLLDDVQAVETAREPEVAAAVGAQGLGHLAVAHHHGGHIQAVLAGGHGGEDVVHVEVEGEPAAHELVVGVHGVPIIIRGEEVGGHFALGLLGIVGADEVAQVAGVAGVPLLVLAGHADDLAELVGGVEALAFKLCALVGQQGKQVTVVLFEPQQVGERTVVGGQLGVVLGAERGHRAHRLRVVHADVGQAGNQVVVVLTHRSSLVRTASPPAGDGGMT